MRMRMEMNEGIAPDVFTYTLFLNWYMRQNRMEEAHELLAEMQDAGVEPSRVTMNSIAAHLMERGNIGEGRQNIQRMESAGDADLYTYSSTIKGLLRQHKVNAAVRVLRSMSKEKGIRPSVVHYSLIIAFMIKAKRRPEAMKLFEEMKKAGIQADLVLYSTLINGAYSDGQIEEAATLLDEMKGLGIRPNVVLFGSIINILLLQKRMEEAEAMMRQMVFEGIRPDTLIFNMFVRARLEQDNIPAVVSLLKRMDDLRLFVDNSFINLVLEYFARKNMLEEANTLLRMLTEAATECSIDNEFCSLVCMYASLAVKHNNLRPDTRTWSTLLLKYLNDKNYDQLRALAQRARHAGTHFDAFTYNLLMKCELQTGNHAAAQTLCEEMLQKSIQPDDFFNRKIKPELIRHSQRQQSTELESSQSSTSQE